MLQSAQAKKPGRFLWGVAFFAFLLLWSACEGCGAGPALEPEGQAEKGVAREPVVDADASADATAPEESSTDAGTGEGGEGETQAEIGTWENRGIPPWDGPPLDGGVPEGHVWKKLPKERRYAQRVVSFRPAAGASFGHEDFPAKIKGPPQGLGEAKGSLHTVSLGCGGSIVLEFSAPLIGNGPGPDFIIYENAFNPGGGKETFAEPARISVSIDGKTWHAFPCDPKTWPHPQCAGVKPVFANPKNKIDTSDPTKAGGDAYDLAALKLPYIRFIKIEDLSDQSPDAMVWCGAYNAGFDLDAVAVIYGFTP